MRPHLWLAGLLTVGLVLPTLARAWEIASFETQVAVHEGATATVTETIVADFGGETRHGLYRDIPVHYVDRAGQHFVLRLRVRDVTDELGRPWRYQLESWGPFRRVRIGDADATVSGRQTYRIVYEVQRGAVRFFPDHDECYWNLTGNEWAVPMHRVRAELVLPDAARDLRAVAYAGGYGSTARVNAEVSDHRVVLEPSRPFEPYEGLTAAVSWAKGAVHPPSVRQVLGWWLSDNWVYGLPLLVLAGMLWLWSARGRDPHPLRSQVVQYAPPDGLTPAEIGTLMDQRVNLRDVTATIVDLAVRGHLTIQPIPGLFGQMKDYRFTCVAPWRKDAKLKPHETELLKGLFRTTDTPGASVELSDLENVFYQRLPTVREQLYLSLIGGGYLDSNPETVRTSYLIGGPVLGILMGAALGASRSWHQLPSAPIILASVCSAVIVMLIGLAMPRRTLKGAETTDRLFGFLEFLRRTDQDRIRRINDPGLFERCLPYALAFGVANQWARAFEGIYTQPPSWYAGEWDSFSARRLGRDLDHATASMGRSFASQPRSSSSGSWGGSGSGGGGFSGGGGGGGGGGAW